MCFCFVFVLRAKTKTKKLARNEICMGCVKISKDVKRVNESDVHLWNLLKHTPHPTPPHPTPHRCGVFTTRKRQMQRIREGRSLESVECFPSAKRVRLFSV